jgi:hypothetical protein
MRAMRPPLCVARTVHPQLQRRPHLQPGQYARDAEPSPGSCFNRQPRVEPRRSGRATNAATFSPPEVTAVTVRQLPASARLAGPLSRRNDRRQSIRNVERRARQAQARALAQPDRRLRSQFDDEFERFRSMQPRPHELPLRMNATEWAGVGRLQLLGGEDDFAFWSVEDDSRDYGRTRRADDGELVGAEPGGEVIGVTFELQACELN